MPHGGFMLFFLGAMVVYLVARVFGLKKKGKKTDKLLQALHANKDLKATVEAHTGMQIPKPTPCPFSKNGNQNMSFCGKVVRIAVLFNIVVITSFVISISSLEITACIVNAMDGGEGQANYEAPPTSPLVALTILLLVCTVEISLFFLALRGLRTLCKHLHGSPNHRQAQAPPSAPMGEYESSNISTHGSTHGYSSNSPTLAASSRHGGMFPPSSTRLQQWRAYAANAFRRPSPGPNSMYQPLNPHSEHESMDVTVHSPMMLPPQGAEMVVVGRDGQGYHYARPVSTVNFV